MMLYPQKRIQCRSDSDLLHSYSVHGNGLFSSLKTKNQDHRPLVDGNSALFFPQFTYILSWSFLGFIFATFLKLFHRHDFCIVHLHLQIEMYWIDSIFTGYLTVLSPQVCHVGVGGQCLHCQSLLVDGSFHGWCAAVDSSWNERGMSALKTGFTNLFIPIVPIYSAVRYR